MPIAHDNPDTRAIRALREAFNEAIARHDARAISACWSDDVQVTAAGGQHFAGAEAVRAAFGGFFADPDFVTFARTPADIDISRDRNTAAEAGTWAGTWQRNGALSLSRGRYLAAWQRQRGQWRLKRELYVQLEG